MRCASADDLASRFLYDLLAARPDRHRYFFSFFIAFSCCFGVMRFPGWPFMGGYDFFEDVWAMINPPGTLRRSIAVVLSEVVAEHHASPSSSWPDEMPPGRHLPLRVESVRWL